jgi:hypothetical protein
MILRDADAGPYLTDGTFRAHRYEPTSFFARLQRMDYVPRFGRITAAHPSPCRCDDAFPVAVAAGDSIGLQRCEQCGGLRPYAKRPQHQQSPSSPTLP